jgi:hypothetical protein
MSPLSNRRRIVIGIYVIVVVEPVPYSPLECVSEPPTCQVGSAGAAIAGREETMNGRRTHTRMAVPGVNEEFRWEREKPVA